MVFCCVFVCIGYDGVEDEWSNIDYQFEENWRYKNCPLIYKEYLNMNKGILNITQFVELNMND